MNSLPNVCFGFELYRHSIDACPKDRTLEPMEENNMSASIAKKIRSTMESGECELRALDARRMLTTTKRKGMDYNRGKNQGRYIGESRFNVLSKIHGGNDIVGSIVEKERTTEEDKGQRSDKRGGPKVGLKVLKPITNSGGLLLGKGQKGLDDRAKMSKASELDDEYLFGFQAIQIKALLDSRKNKAMKIIQAR
ncbi:hypothetical protein GOBAR_AA09939 [Gossypium barbadense]|uniref:Uncharacterized protein n=1 Tax=Gossypium barbadense TaxID=3634 RepID=A0A2P5Y571_GOSBA|nr:hypothetical protein GOBAR_AA09939 [Gossypium barbadense]